MKCMNLFTTFQLYIKCYFSKYCYNLTENRAEEIHALYYDYYDIRQFSCEYSTLSLQVNLRIGKKWHNFWTLITLWTLAGHLFELIYFSMLIDLFNLLLYATLINNTSCICYMQGITVSRHSSCCCVIKQSIQIVSRC